MFLKYEERIAIIRPFVIDMLKRYERPSHLDDPAAIKEIETIIQDINSDVPTNTNEGRLKHMLDKMFQKTRKKHTSRFWPTQKMLTSHIIEAANETADPDDPTMQRDYDPRDTDEINARRIKALEPVGEHWVYGKAPERLIAKGLIEARNLLPYKKSLEYEKRKAYGTQ